MYTYKVMIHPNNKQSTKIRRTLNKCIECQNIVYDYLDSFIKANKNIPTCAEVRKWFTIQKTIKDNEVISKRNQMTKKEQISNHLDTLFYDVSNDALKQTVKDTYNSFVRFFKKTSSYPKRKDYKDKRKSYYIDPYKIEFSDKKVKLEKIANNQKINRQILNWINMAEKNRIPVGVKYYNPRVSYDGKNFFITVSVDDEHAPVKKRKQLEDKVIGIDLNNAEIVTSENVRYNQITKSKAYKKLSRKRCRIQKSLSRKYNKCNPNKSKTYKLSNNYKKNKILLKRIDKRLMNKRNENHNQIITDILNTPPKKIVLEDLSIKEMSNKETRKDKNIKEKLASKNIVEANMRKFRIMLTNRANKYGVNVVIVDKYYPSTKKCSRCGNIKEMDISDRIYCCDCCNIVIDRDLNAAINLAKYIYK